MPISLHAVDHFVHPNGSDANDGLTEDTPWASIEHAGATSVDGSNIWLAMGGEWVNDGCTFTARAKTLNWGVYDPASGKRYIDEEAPQKASIDCRGKLGTDIAVAWESGTDNWQRLRIPNTGDSSSLEAWHNIYYVDRGGALADLRRLKRVPTDYFTKDVDGDDSARDEAPNTYVDLHDASLVKNIEFAYACANSDERTGSTDWFGMFPGSWQSGDAYVIGDRVVSGGNYYRCILAHTNQAPPNATYWVQINQASMHHDMWVHLTSQGLAPSAAPYDWYIPNHDFAVASRKGSVTNLLMAGARHNAGCLTFLTSDLNNELRWCEFRDNGKHAFVVATGKYQDWKSYDCEIGFDGTLLEGAQSGVTTYGALFKNFEVGDRHQTGDVFGVVAGPGVACPHMDSVNQPVSAYLQQVPIKLDTGRVTGRSKAFSYGGESGASVRACVVLYNIKTYAPRWPTRDPQGGTPVAFQITSSSAGSTRHSEARVYVALCEAYGTWGAGVQFSGKWSNSSLGTVACKYYSTIPVDNGGSGGDRRLYIASGGMALASDYLGESSMDVASASNTFGNLNGRACLWMQGDDSGETAWWDASYNVFQSNGDEVYGATGALMPFNADFGSLSLNVLDSGITDWPDNGTSATTQAWIDNEETNSRSSAISFVDAANGDFTLVDGLSDANAINAGADNYQNVPFSLAFVQACRDCTVDRPATMGYTRSGPTLGLTFDNVLDGTYALVLSRFQDSESDASASTAAYGAGSLVNVTHPEIGPVFDRTLDLSVGAVRSFMLVPNASLSLGELGAVPAPKLGGIHTFIDNSIGSTTAPQQFSGVTVPDVADRWLLVLIAAGRTGAAPTIEASNAVVWSPSGSGGDEEYLTRLYGRVDTDGSDENADNDLCRNNGAGRRQGVYAYILQNPTAAVNGRITVDPSEWFTHRVFVATVSNAISFGVIDRARDDVMTGGDTHSLPTPEVVAGSLALLGFAWDGGYSSPVAATVPAADGELYNPSQSSDNGGSAAFVYSIPTTNPTFALTPDGGGNLVAATAGGVYFTPAVSDDNPMVLFPQGAAPVHSPVRQPVAQPVFHPVT
ncbi:MAG: hypothetical protein AAF663_00115 [Planctomycetota bacterium]